MRVLLFISIMIPTLLSCDSNNSKTEIQKDDKTYFLDNISGLKKTRKLLLSELVDSIEYIKLESNSENYFTYSSFALGEKYIVFASMNPAKILVFNRKGDFIRIIGSAGNGPGEYNSPMGIDLSPDETKLMILDFGKWSWMEYNINGEHIQTIKHRMIPTAESHYYLTNDILVFMQDYIMDSLNFPLIMSLNLETHEEKPVYSINMKKIADPTKAFHNESIIGRDFKGISFKHYLSDTLFNINPDLSLSPSVIIDIGNKPKPSYTLFPEDRETRYVRFIYQFPHHLLISFIYGKPYKQVYDTHFDELYKLPDTKDCPNDSNSRPNIINDMDGLESFWPSSQVNIHNSQLMELFEINNFKELCKSSCFLEAELVTEKYRESIIKIAEEADENDNPIVRILHLR